MIAPSLATAGNTAGAERVAAFSYPSRGYWSLLPKPEDAPGNANEAKTFANDAERAAKAIIDGPQREEALHGIARILASGGNTADAERVDAAVPTIWGRAFALTGIAQALASAGNSADAERFASGAQGVARRAEVAAITLTNPLHREQALDKVAAALATAGNKVDADASPPRSTTSGNVAVPSR